MNKEKLKVLIDSIKTANEMMRKQIEINGRAVELLGEFITEPEKVEPKSIKPEDMVSGEWYVTEGAWNWLFNFNKISVNFIYYYACVDLMSGEIDYDVNLSLNMDAFHTYRKATQEEILKYFPNELEVPTHGGNDAAYIQEVTDPQV